MLTMTTKGHGKAKKGKIRNISVQPADGGYTVHCEYAPEGNGPMYYEPATPKVFKSDEKEEMLAFIGSKL